MSITRKVSDDGQLSLPEEILDALELHPGDDVHIELHDGRALLSKAPFLARAGSVEVPPEKRGLDWADVRREAWTSRWRERS